MAHEPLDSMSFSAALPMITAKNQTVIVNTSIPAASLIASASDPNGYTITHYDFRDEGGSGGYLSLNGVWQPVGSWITVSASDLANLVFVGSSSAGTEAIDVAAWDGVNWSYYQTATVTTETAALPVITAQNQTVNANASVQASTLIASTNDPNGYAITYYDFRDDGSGGGYLSLDGVRQAAGEWISVSASDLGNLVYIGGATAGSETVDVAAWDGYNWSYYQSATVTTKAVALPVIVVQNESINPNTTIQASSLITSVSDPNGNAITAYDFRDDGGGGGYLTLDGVRQATGQWIQVSVSELANLKYVSGSTPSSESLDIAAWDGLNWSYYQTAWVTTKTLALPVITVQNLTVDVHATIQASDLITYVNDPNGYAIAAYDFRDDGGSAGYLSLNGVRQATGQWITVSAADLSSLQYIGGSTAGSETVDIAASDGFNWSYYQTATAVTKPSQNTNPPVVVAADQTVTELQSIPALSLVGSVTDPANRAITFYSFRDEGGDGGYLVLNGNREATGYWVTVSTADVGNLVFVGGSTPGTEKVDVEAWDGQNWSNEAVATVTAQAPQTQRATIIAQDQTVAVGATIQASSLVGSVSDPQEYAITYYDFRDDGGGGGYLTLNGVPQSPGQWITVSANDLPTLVYVGGSAAGTETVDVAAWDGVNWSYYQTATVTTKAAALPVVTAQNQTLNAGDSIRASQLIASVSDPNGSAISSYRFRDDGGNSGYLSLDGVTQADNTWIPVSAADLAKLTYLAGSAAGSETIDLEVSDGTNWSNYASAVITTQGALPSNSVISRLTDAGIKADATKYISNDDLNYSGMLAILQDAASNGITAAEFADLETIASSFNKTNGITVSSYLAYISDSVIDGNAANANFTGGQLQSVALGNLAAGSSQTQANELIGKWFLGSDLPAPVFDTAPGTAISYTSIASPLYGASGLPSVNDINQGALGDCYLLASLAGIALNEPSAIASMLTDNGNGTYGVRFYIGGSPVYVTVNNQLPIYASTGTLCGNRSSDLWSSLIEKAYVQLNEEPGYTGDHPTGNVYKLIDGGFADPITQITGRAVTSYYSDQYTSTSWEDLKDSIVTAIKNGREVDFGSFGTTSIQGKLAFIGGYENGTLTGHMYADVGYDESAGNFILRNPWGVGGAGQSWLTQFEASLSDLYGVSGDVFVATGDAAASPAELLSMVTISGTAENQTTSDTTAVSPFAGVVVTDPNAGQTVTVTVTLSAPSSGTLSNLGTGSFDESTGIYTVSGSAAAVTGYLNGLVFKPALDQAPAGQTVTTQFTVTVADGAGQARSDSLTSVVSTQTSPTYDLVQSLYQAVLRTPAATAVISPVAQQIDDGISSLSQATANLIDSEQALYTTLPALVTIDAMYGATPSSDTLSTAAAATSGASYYTAAGLHSLGYSDPNVWTIMGSEWSADPNSNFYTGYNSYGSDYSSFISAVYQREFGYTPSAQNLQNLLSDVPGVQALLAGGGHPASPIQVVGGIYGYLLYVGQIYGMGQYASSARAFLQAAANGTVTYGPELTQEYPPATTQTTTGTAASSSVVAANGQSADSSTITITGSNQLIDPGSGSYTIQFMANANADTLVLHAGAVDQVFDLNPNSDALDFSVLLSGANIDLNGNLARLTDYVAVADRGTDALISFTPSEQGNGSTVAVLHGLGSTVTSLSSLIVAGAVTI